MDHAGAQASTPKDALDFAVQFYKTIDDNDWLALVDLFHPEVTYHRPGYDAFIGRESVMHFYREQRRVKVGCHRLERVVARGEEFVCVGEFRGTSKLGAPLAVQFADICLFQDSRVRERRTFFYVAAV